MTNVPIGDITQIQSHAESFSEFYIGFFVREEIVELGGFGVCSPKIIYDI